MYNIHNHYFNIYSLARDIIAEPSVVYLHPFGSSSVENVEVLASPPPENQYVKGDLCIDFQARIGPVLVCYDQEPLLSSFNRELFKFVKDNYVWSLRLEEHHRFHQDIILLNTELDSDEKEKILSEHNFKDCYYFHHAFAARDWYRGYQYLRDLKPITKRTLTKKFITFNRITSNARVYRSLLINELITHNIIDQGHVSFSKNCPDGSNFDEELIKHQSMYQIPESLVTETIDNITSSSNSFRIDHKDEQYIPNNSFHISAIEENMESFVHVVTETCFWGRKKHLTEKIFKPIAMRQPFVLVGCAHNLEYLKSYGFKTFDRWWDESYDQIENDIDRIHAIGNLLEDICKNDLPRLTNILNEMEEVLDHNYNWFYSKEFLDNCWHELVTNLEQAVTSTPLLHNVAQNDQHPRDH